MMEQFFKDGVFCFLLAFLVILLEPLNLHLRR
jgi:hypothetical protein